MTYLFLSGLYYKGKNIERQRGKQRLCCCDIDTMMGAKQSHYYLILNQVRHDEQWAKSSKVRAEDKKD